MKLFRTNTSIPIWRNMSNREIQIRTRHELSISNTSFFISMSDIWQNHLRPTKLEQHCPSSDTVCIIKCSPHSIHTAFLGRYSTPLEVLTPLVLHLNLYVRNPVSPNDLSRSPCWESMHALIILSSFPEPLNKLL